MKVALVHDWLTGMRGGEKCLEVACRRFPEADLYTLLHRKNSTSPAIERMEIRTSFLQSVPAIARFYRYFLPVIPAVIERFRIDSDVDFVLSFSSCVAKGVRPPAGVPHFCYCFSPMRYAWHMKDAYFPTDTSTAGLKRLAQGAAGAARERLLTRIRDWDRLSADRVTHFIANSHTVAQRIQDCYGRESRVIHSPVDTEFYTPGDVQREDYYLYVSALVPYKRVDLAIEACRKLGRKLVVIGSGQMLRSIAPLSSPDLQVLGWRSNEEIRWHLRRCRALLFPGLEDFGIVPLEAQACGAPVLAYGRGGATETILPAENNQPGTGLFFYEQTTNRLCETILEFESNPQRISPALARQQAVKFSVENFQHNLFSYIDSVVQQQTPGIIGGEEHWTRDVNEPELRRAA